MHMGEMKKRESELHKSLLQHLVSTFSYKIRSNYAYSDNHGESYRQNSKAGSEAYSRKFYGPRTKPNLFSQKHYNNIKRILIFIGE